jgi:hypothetical protein
MARADYRVVKTLAQTVFLVDENRGGTSVTNDAEAVVAEVLEQYDPTCRIVYRDTMGNWDELAHDGESFIDFLPWLGPVPEIA